MKFFVRQLAGTLVAALLLTGLTASRAKASTYTVTNLMDTGTNGCTAAGNGDGCSLREAIAAAETDSTPDTINFAVSGSIVIKTPFTITKDVSITGPDTGVTIDGFDVSTGFLINGGNVAFTNFNILDCHGQNAAGGLEVSGGTVTLKGMNFWGDRGGATASPYPPNGCAGALDVTGGTVLALNSTFSHSLGSPANSFTGQLAAAGAGCIQLSGGSLTCVNCTVTTGQGGSGSSSSSHPFIGGTGGIANLGGTLNLVNTIVTQNTGGTTPGNPSGNGADNTSGTISTNISNILTGTGVVNSTASHNGGPTWTCSIPSTSSARNAGDNSQATAYGLTTDQRGYPRVSGTKVDIGAYEYQQEHSSLVVGTLNDVVDSFDGQTSLREAITYANSLTGPSTITFAYDLAGTITLTSALPGIVRPLTIQGSNITTQQVSQGAPTGITVDGANTYQAFDFNTVGDATLKDFSVTNCRSGTGPAVRVDTAHSLTLQNMTLFSNHGGPATPDASNSGPGAVEIYGGGVHIIQSTLYGNIAGGGDSQLNGTPFDAGAVTIKGGTVEIVQSSITANRGASGMGGISVAGGALTLSNSVVAGNTSSNSVNISGSYTEGGPNLTAGSVTTSGGLHSNGGPTNTVAFTSSGIFNAGSDAVAQAYGLTTDQRGPGYARFASGHVDLGAYETQSPAGSGIDVSVSLWVGENSTTKLGGSSSPGATYSIVDGTLPPGLNLDSASGLITGPPTQAGSFSITYRYTRDGTNYTPGRVDFTVNPSVSFVVTTLNDTVSDTDGLTSLREAVTNAVGHPGAETITFDPSLSGSINLQSPLPTLDSLNISGPGADVITIRRGTGSMRIFTVGVGATVNLSGLTIANGKLDSTTADNFGGGIYSDGKLTLTACRVTGNTVGTSGGSTKNSGGGIYSTAYSTVKLVDSTIDGNSVAGTLASNPAAGSGGGVTALGGLTVTQCTMTGNSADGYGGAIYAGPSNSAAVSYSTIIKNTAGLDGGGSYGGQASNFAVSIVAGNTPTDIAAANNVVSNGYNLVGACTNFTPIASDQSGVTLNQIFGAASPSLTTAQGGHTPLFPLSTNSLAIGAGPAAADANTLAYDQRGLGFARQFGPAIDAGSFEVQVNQPPAAAPQTFTGQVGIAFSDSISASDVDGDALTFALADGSSLPAGLQLDPATGALSGTPTAAVNGPCTFIISDATHQTSIVDTFQIKEAPSLVVTTLSDTVSDYDGVTSLREALNYAGLHSGADEIIFAVSGTITLSADLPAINQDVTVTGPDAGITVNGADTYRLFNITGGTVTLQRFTLAHGLTGLQATGGTVTLSGMTLAANTSASGAGGVSIAGGNITLLNCTVANNFGSTAGGLETSAAGPAPVTTLVHCTFTGNFGGSGFPGGILAGSSVTLANSIVSLNNPGSAAPNNDIRGSYVVQGKALIGGTPKLGALASNGGPTQTVMPADDSPAINGGDDATATAFGLTTDQRGAGFPRVFGTHVDLGAVELERNPDSSAPHITVVNPASGARPLITDFVAGYVNGTASDDVSVAGVSLQLSRVRADVTQYWNGSNWTTDAGASCPAYVPNPNNTAWYWNDGLPSAADLDAGSYTLSATVTDGFGRASKVTRGFTLVADPNPPTVTVSAPGVNQNLLPAAFVAGTVNGTATDDVGVTGVDVKLYRTVSGVKQYWNGTAFDTASVSVPAVLTPAGAANVTWRLNNVPSTAQLSIGAYSVQVVAHDTENSSVAVTRNFNIVGDTTPPVATISNPASGAVMLPQTFVDGGLNGTATDDNSVASVTVKLYRTVSGAKQYWDGSAFGTASVGVLADLGSGTWNLPLPSAADLLSGSYGVSVVAKDPSGNSVTLTRSFTILGDVTPPAGSIAHPAPNANLLPSVFAASIVDGTATDNTAVASVAVKLFRTVGGVKQFWTGTAWTTDSVAATAFVTGLGTASASWTLSPLPAASDLAVGAYGVQSQIKDPSGNTTLVTCPFNIVADATPPVTTIATPTANQHVVATAFDANTVHGTATDTGGAVASVSVKLYRTVAGVKYFWNGASFGTASISAPVATTGLGSENATWNLSPAPSSSDLIAGAYSVQASAKDTAGNTSTIVTRNFTVDAPSASLKMKPSAQDF